MPKVLKEEAAQDIIKRAVTALAGGDAAQKVEPFAKAAFAVARDTVLKNSGGKRKPNITSLKVTQKSAGLDGTETVTTIFDQRQPTGSGPNKRVPIRVGGGHCVTINLDSKTKITICVEWES